MQARHVCASLAQHVEPSPTLPPDVLTQGLDVHRSLLLAESLNFSTCTIHLQQDSSPFTSTRPSVSRWCHLNSFDLRRGNAGSQVHLNRVHTQATLLLLIVPLGNTQCRTNPPYPLLPPSTSTPSLLSKTPKAVKSTQAIFPPANPQQSQIKVQPKMPTSTSCWKRHATCPLETADPLTRGG